MWMAVPGAPSDASGSFETTIDVEQAGGIAPAAKIIFYQAPFNTDHGFVDAFAAAVDNNSADSVSTSWGFWEWFRDLSTVSDPATGQPVNDIQAFHELFLRAAIQGQTLFASSGDSGAYELVQTSPRTRKRRALRRSTLLQGQSEEVSFLQRLKVRQPHRLQHAADAPQRHHIHGLPAVIDPHHPERTNAVGHPNLFMQSGKSSHLAPLHAAQ
jgi:hypothetical protein